MSVEISDTPHKTKVRRVKIHGKSFVSLEVALKQYLVNYTINDINVKHRFVKHNNLWHILDVKNE